MISDMVRKKVRCKIQKNQTLRVIFSYMFMREKRLYHPAFDFSPRPFTCFPLCPGARTAPTTGTPHAGPYCPKDFLSHTYPVQGPPAVPVGTKAGHFFGGERSPMGCGGSKVWSRDRHQNSGCMVAEQVGGEVDRVESKGQSSGQDTHQRPRFSPINGGGPERFHLKKKFNSILM